MGAGSDGHEAREPFLKTMCGSMNGEREKERETRKMDSNF